jgi:glycosyltransferase involved in cell wall biosynthesis
MMPRVAIVCGAGIVSGKEVMALELAKGLQEQGCSVEVVTSFWGSGEFRSRCEAAGLRTHIMRLGFISATLDWDCVRMTGHQVLFWPKLLADYRSFLKRREPSKVVHTNWHHLLLLWPYLSPARDVYWVHDITPQTPRYKRFFRSLASRLAYFVPVSHAVAESIEKVGISQRKVRVIHSGIEGPAHGSAIPSKKERAVAIGIVGQIGPWKGHEDLLAAFAQIVGRCPFTELHVFGKGQPQHEDQLKHRAAALGIAERIIWHGFVADRAKVYQSIDICVVPSRCDEALGMVAIEAAFFGIPVIASRRGGLMEVVEDQVTGLLFPSGDIEKLALALEMLISDTIFRRRLGEQAHRRISEKFSRDRFINEFFHLLNTA